MGNTGNMGSGGVPGLRVTGRYRLVESIGQGGMGRVWRAADEMLDRQVAVKEMRIDGLDPEDTRTRRERTLREARATARIDHPNVVRVYDVVDEGERLWIVMELVAGRSLERMLADDGALGPREVACIGLGLVAALRQVHAGGVLHRDIKPGNVLVESHGHRVVLTDFGIAAIQDATALTVVGMLVGSPDYMAPERISGHPQGPPSDIWSLGATLCAALGGRSPFSRDTTLATLHAVLYEEPELPSAAGPLRDILAALLRKQPEARPGLDELERVLVPVASPPEEPGGPAGQGREELAAPETELEEESPPVAYRESPTPAFLPPPLVRAARDPRVYEPAPDRDPHPVEDAIPTQRPAVAEPASAAEEPASAAEAASESSSEASSNNRRTAPRRTGVSLDRADRGERAAQAERGDESQLAERAAALTARKPVALPAHPPAPRPAPPHPDPGPHPARSPRPALRRPDLGPHPARVPRSAAPSAGGELPGPAQPFAPEGTHRTRRRTGLIAAAAVVVAGAVVGTILANSGGSAGTSSASAGSSTSPSPTATSPSTSPSPTVEGTSRPPTLPPGTHREAGGFAWATPNGWRRDLKTGAEVHYTSPDGSQELVGKSSLARGDLMETWEASERNAHQGESYRKIRLDRTTFRGYPAVSWEYTFTLKGVPWHARLLGFDEDGKSYQINTWYQPGVETQALKTYDRVKNSFVVL
ncbi:serine/threonine-protein kinase [Streptomyces sp. NPDC048504]|uniref:serine/threonine-protein kinase n=1 Tax=Streptomyces sp. NPDC048504 TaxID=3365559 RepID=UPI00371CBB64